MDPTSYNMIPLGGPRRRPIGRQRPFVSAQFLFEEMSVQDYESNFNFIPGLLKSRNVP